MKQFVKSRVLLVQRGNEQHLLSNFLGQAMLRQASSAAASSTAHQLQWHRCVTCVHSRVGAAALHIARRRVGNPCRVAMNEASAAAAEPAAASLPVEEAIEQPRLVSSLPWVRASPAQAAQLDEAEVERRRKISEANSGRVPWNKGRKHSPGEERTNSALSLAAAGWCCLS